MRVVPAALLTTAALLLASVASAQGLGAAAAREKERRKAVEKPAKVYTESDVGRSMAPVSSEPVLPAAADAAEPATVGEAPVDGQPAVAGEPAEGADGATEGVAEGAPPPAATPAVDTAAQAAEEQRQAARESWRRKLDQARKEEAAYKDVIDKVQADLNDITGGLYSPGRASKVAFLDETKQKLAETQGRISALEEEGRRNRY